MADPSGSAGSGLPGENRPEGERRGLGCCENTYLSPSRRSEPPQIWSAEELQLCLASKPHPVTFDLRTMDEAAIVANLIAQSYPCPETAEMGIWELLANAIEHGNLGISHDEKTDLIARGALEQEIEIRLCEPVLGQRVVRVHFCIHQEAIHLLVQDEGAGFDYSAFSAGIAGTDKPHGRGIAIARDLAFDDLSYKGCGNEVEAVCFASGPEKP